MDLERKRIELESEIADIQSEIEVKVAALDEVRSLLDKESFEEAHADELDDEDFVVDEEDDDEGLDDNETEDEDFEDEEIEIEEELKARESELMEEILVLQMKVAALTKQLNDILAQQGMNSLGESEE